MFKEYRGLRKELYILFIGRLVTNMGSMIWPILTLVLNQKLGMNASEIATYTLIVSIVSIPVSLLGGKIADKFNKRNIIIICDIISFVGFMIAGLLPISLLAVIIYSTASLFQTAEHASYDALVADFTTSEDRERAYSLNYLGGNLGLILSPIIGGFLFKDHLSLAFIINGVAILLSAILLFVFIKDVSKTTSENDSIYEKDLDKGVSVINFLKVNGIIVLLILIEAAEGGLYNQFNYLIPLDLGRLFGEDGAAIFSSLFSINCFIVFAFTALITRKGSRIKALYKVLIGVLLIIMSYIIFILFMGYKFISYIVIVIFTFGEIFTMLGFSPYLSKRIPASHRGRIISIDTVSRTLFYSLFTKLTGYTYDTKGSTSAWLVTIGLGVIIVIAIFYNIYLDKKKYPELQ